MLCYVRVDYKQHGCNHAVLVARSIDGQKEINGLLLACPAFEINWLRLLLLKPGKVDEVWRWKECMGIAMSKWHHVYVGTRPAESSAAVSALAAAATLQPAAG